MQNSLREALRPVFTIDIENKGVDAKKLCLLPGIYSTVKTVAGFKETKPYTVLDGNNNPITIEIPTIVYSVLSYADPSNLINAGYFFDLVADDDTDGQIEADSGIAMTAIGRAKMRDFRNEVQRVGMKCTKIVIMNKKDDDQSIFDQQIEVCKTVVGAKGGTDYINLQQYVDVNAYNEKKITIDLSGVDENGVSKALELTPEVLMGMPVPAGAHFSMQFVFNNSVSGL